MATRSKVADKMLQAVLADPSLQRFGEYELSEIKDMTVDEAVVSNNHTIHAVGVIIERINENASMREVYNEVSEYLKNNI